MSRVVAYLELHQQSQDRSVWSGLMLFWLQYEPGPPSDHLELVSGLREVSLVPHC